MAALRARIIRAYQEAFSGLPTTVWILCATALVNRAGTMVLPFLGLYMTQARDFSPAQAGQLVGLYGIGAAAGSALGGWVTDRIGPIRTMQATLILSGIGFLSLVRIESTVFLAVAIFVVSTVAEAYRPAVMTAIAEHAGESVSRAFALLRLAANLGMAIGPAIGGFLAARDYSLLFLADALTCWLAATLIAILLRSATAPASRAHDTAGPSRSPWRDGPFLLLLCLVFVLAAMFLQVFTTLPIYLNRDYGLDADAIGLLIGLNALMIVLFEMVLIRQMEGRDRFYLIGVGSFLICSGFALLPLGRTAIWAALSVVIWTIGEMLTLPLTNTVVAERAGPAHRGRYMGFYTVAFAAAFIVAPLAGTWTYERFGPDALWYLSGVLGVPVWLASIRLGRSFVSAASGPTSGCDPA